MSKFENLLVLLLSCVLSLGAALAESGACPLISSDEIEAVQGDKVAAAKGSQRSGGGFLSQQCFYSLTEFSKSVSLEVVSSDPKAASSKSVREHWAQRFHADDDSDSESDDSESESDDSESESEDDESGDSDPPVGVAGLGDEAFWVSDSFVGVLYVLQGDRFFRISVGGADESPVRQKKSIQLARHVLSRLS